MKALYFERFGGPQVLQYGDLPDPASGDDTAVVRTTAIGLNFADVYRRQGRYHLAGTPPYIAGYEAAGIVVDGGGYPPAWLHEGRRVAFADSPFANAELVAVPYDKLIPLPDDVSDETAAAVLLQGLTAQYLTRDSYRITSGDVAVVHAAAGGVGLLLLQMSKHAGAYVIAFASTAEKCRAALAYGADEAYTYTEWPGRAQNAGVIYDSVGTTLDESIAAVAARGTVVFYGMAGGDPNPVDPRVLMDGSKTLTGGDLWNVLTSRDERVRRAEELFDLVRSGAIRVPIAGRYALSLGATAHEYLESRAAIGKVLLIP
ncbi:MAG TPA: quinone oxidoreductase [Candidatus Baltobacteraceae bacterium]|nr:quinone oxidoreductase [Candidatus Baltobacteraceae bacterium]